MGAEKGKWHDEMVVDCVGGGGRGQLGAGRGADGSREDEVSEMKDGRKRVVVMNRQALCLAGMLAVGAVACLCLAESIVGKCYSGLLLLVSGAGLGMPICVMDADGVQIRRFLGLSRQRVSWNEIRQVTFELKPQLSLRGGRWADISVVHLSCNDWKEIEFSLVDYLLDWKLAEYIRTVLALDNRAELPSFSIIQATELPKRLVPFSRVGPKSLFQWVYLGFIFWVFLSLLAIVFRRLS